MGDLGELRKVFAEDWDWSTAGEEWSAWWGGTPALWYGALLPRIHEYVPARTILEIAPGFGRWTQYLKDLGDRLILVDLAEKCIEHCRERFSAAEHISYHVNDGRSLDMVEDGSVDFVFSWDSLVHVDADVIEDYVRQIAKKLSPNGVAFLHHSNVGALRRSNRLAARMPEPVRRPLVRRGLLLDVYAWRSTNVDAVSVARMAGRHGAVAVAQELFTWENGSFLTEAVSVLALPGSRWASVPRGSRENPWFSRTSRLLAELYAGPAQPGTHRPETQ